MKTLSAQLPQVSDWAELQREKNQDCELVSKRDMMQGATIFLFDFVSKSGHPYDAKGQNVIVVEDDGVAYRDNSYKNLFQ